MALPNNFLNSFLTNKVVDVPVESEFPSTGFIGQLSAKMLYQYVTALDLLGPEFRDDVPTPYFREQRKDGRYVYYFEGRDQADSAAKMDPEAFAPLLVWYFSMPVSSVINVDVTNFTSPNISRSCRVTSLRSKHRHEFHMITLPAIVAATAKMAGYKVPELDWGVCGIRGSIISDEMSFDIIGDKSNYEESILWKQRAELWKALGEDDPKKYLVGVKDARGNPAKGCTDSEKLIECLSLYYREWGTRPLWAKLLLVEDPSTKAVMSTGNRLTVPAVMEVYASEKEANEAKERDIEKMAGIVPKGATGKTTSKDSSADTSVLPEVIIDDMPPLPSGWEDNLNDWVTTITPFTAMAKPIARKQWDPEEYGVDFDQMWIWVEFLKAK